MSEEFLNIKKEIASMVKKQENFSEWQQRYLLLQPDLEEMERVLVEPETPIDFVQFLEKEAEDSELLIKISLVSSKEKPATSFSPLSFKLILSGSFPDCLQFLDKLETAPYLIDINGLNLRAQAKEQPFGQVELELLIKVLARSS